MHYKLVELFRYTQKHGLHPSYRSKDETNYLECLRESFALDKSYKLTIRQIGNEDKHYGMSYVCINNLQTKAREFYYIRIDPDYYQREIDNAKPLKDYLQPATLIGDAYELFIEKR